MPHHHHYKGAEIAKTAPEPLPHHVMIATPTSRGLVPSYALSLAATIDTLVHFGIQFDYQILADDCHVDDARNLIIRNFLQSECTDLFFIDSDMGWRAQDFVRILRVPGDIVGGVYRHKQDKDTYPFHPGLGEREANEHGLFEMPKVATGFMRIRRPVLEALHEVEAKRGRCMWPKSERAKRGIPMARIVERAFIQDLDFEVPKTTEQTYHSGDYVLCLKAKNAGFSIFADLDCYFDHIGEKIWGGHFGNHLRREQEMDRDEFASAVRAIGAGDVSEAAFAKLIAANIYGHYTLPPAGLKAAYEMARRARGDVLECGSGLSTLVMGLALAGTGRRLYALEHDLHWLRQTGTWLERYGLANVVLIHAPLTPYEGGDWYAIGPSDLPPGIDAVLVDGPPRSLSNRKLVFSHLADMMQTASSWLIDDCQPSDRAQVGEWAAGRSINWIEDPASERLICEAKLIQPSIQETSSAA